MSESMHGIAETFQQLMAGIEVCLERQLQFPTLTLVYSGIDAVAWLGSAPTETAVRARFTRWVDKYLLAKYPLPCRAIDLYAARCGMLHTLTGDAQLIELGEAIPLSYAWGVAEASDLQVAIDRNMPGRLTAVHVNDLVGGFRAGALAMFAEAETNKALESRMALRANRFFTSLPADVRSWPKLRKPAV
jgi:hypothetical protein